MTVFDIFVLGWIVNILSVLISFIYIVHRIYQTIGITEFMIYQQKQDGTMSPKQKQRMYALLLPFVGLYNLYLIIYREHKYFRENPNDSFLDFVEHEIEMGK